jgi:hypothetical protein
MPAEEATKHVPGIKYIGSKLVGFGTVGINHDITVLFLAY